MLKLLKKKYLILLISLISMTIFAENLNYSQAMDISGGFVGFTPQITSDLTGQNVFAIWEAATSDIQTARSTDFGASWSLTTTLSASGAAPQIASDDSGQYVFAIYRDGANIQTARSIDFGLTWTKTTNLGEGITPQITTSSSGKYVHVVWNSAGQLP